MANAHTISVGQAAVDAHLAHGDTLGECADLGEPANPGNSNRNGKEKKEKSKSKSKKGTAQRNK